MWIRSARLNLWGRGWDMLEFRKHPRWWRSIRRNICDSFMQDDLGHEPEAHVYCSLYGMLKIWWVEKCTNVLRGIVTSRWFLISRLTPSVFKFRVNCSDIDHGLLIMLSVTKVICNYVYFSQVHAYLKSIFRAYNCLNSFLFGWIAIVN